MATVTREAPRKLSFGPDHKALADFAAASNRRAMAWLVLVCLVAFLPGFFTIPPVDRDEARFAQATKQMLEGAGYVDIRFQDEVRYKKPIGIYWLQAAAVRLGEAAGALLALSQGRESCPLGGFRRRLASGHRFCPDGTAWAIR